MSPKPKIARKKPGRFGASTAYTEFINWLMNPDPTKRPTPAQARQHRFLTDPMLSPEEAQAVLRDVLKNVPPPPTGPDAENKADGDEPAGDDSDDDSDDDDLIPRWIEDPADHYRQIPNPEHPKNR